MAKKRSKSLQATIDSLNSILALDTVCVTNVGHDAPKEDIALRNLTSLKNARSYSCVGQTFKQGIAEALENILHKHNSYNGYMFLYPNDEDRKFDRKYF